MAYPWFAELKQGQVNDLQQGDLIPNCPIIIPPPSISDGEIELELKEIDSLILSQSCDLVNGKIEIVLVCPYYKLDLFLENLPQQQQGRKAKQKIIENLRKGHLPGYHLLNRDLNLNLVEDYQVVDFRNVYGIQFSSLFELAEKLTPRVRLLPPYREHLSQAFARYFMRVGLPQDITIEGY